MGGRLGIGRESAYCASKFALCGWSEVLYVDLHGTGVNVKLVEPGPIDTEIWDLPENETAAYSGPLYPPDVVGEVILQALRGEGGFEMYAPPELAPVVEYKTANVTQYLDGLAAFEASVASP
jgi:NAD(P)-dependent dehydrogenase (short-subunit alcohol dehydrogenase family)